MKQTDLCIPAAIAASALLGGCVQARPLPAPAAVAASSILASSNPAAGSTVTGPVNAVALRFNPAARLNEIIVDGPNGTMPVMVTAVGEVRDYSVPVSGLGSGRYTLRWRASVKGVDYQGQFGFDVR